MLENQEFIKDFIEEAIVHVETVESGLLKLDDQFIDPENINKIFRAVHSMKGTAGFFGLKKIVELSHAMENIFGALRNNSLIIEREKIDVLLSANDCLKSMIQDINNSENVEIQQYINILSEILKPTSRDTAKAFEPVPLKLPALNTISEKLSDSMKDLIDNGLKHGHKLYKVQLNLNKDLDVREINPIHFFKQIEEIGTIIDTYTDTSCITELDECLNSEIIFSFLFTTVLEKKLLPLALEIPLSCIQELDLDLRKDELSKIVSENIINKDISSNIITQMPTQNMSESLVKESQKQIANVQVEDSIRVHVNLLNNLLNLASEMVLGRNQLLRTVEKYRKNIPGLDPILQNIDRITTEMQEKVMQTRMQPVGNVFSKFPRIIRELSKKLEKDIELKLEGTEVELDKSIIEALTDPLTHLVRNAADHGIEKPEVRELQGKNSLGFITLKAYHEGGYVNIDVVDDGNGLNLGIIKKKALEKELISKQELSTLGDSEILQLLFKPGFSTVDKITDVSGRGVGMDVVKTNIEKLGGTVEIFTKLGQGTTFRLLLPLTLAIIPSLIVEVERQKFALPQVNLQEIVRIKPGDPTRKIEYIHNSEVLRLRGRLLPIIHLADVLGLKRTFIDPNTGERKEEKRRALYDQRQGKTDSEPLSQNSSDTLRDSRYGNSNIIRILVLKLGSKKFGIAVDKINGSEETLVKPLPVYLKESKCYSGVTILGDGKAALILDPEGVIEKGCLKFVDENDEKALRDSENANESMREQQNLLLFKGSGTETFGIDLSMVARVEEINSTDIENVGVKQFIKYRGDSLRVIRLEDFLPVSHEDNKPKRLYVIIPKLVKHPLGILIEKIHDTVQTSIKLNEEDIKAKGLMGSTILQNRLILLINMYEIFEKADPEHFSIDTSKKVGEGKTVLLVEDTPFFQKLERNYFEVAGYKVILGQNGKEALQLLHENEVDIIVSDINMPIMDGIELVKKIREDKKFSTLPVIAVTSMTGDSQVQLGLDAGFDFYEFKLDKPQLLKTVELAVKKIRDPHNI